MEGIIDDEFVKHLDAFNIQGIARERMLAMSQEDRQVLLAKWKRGSSFAPPTQTAPPRVLSSLPRSNSGRSIDSDVSTGSNPRPAPPRTQSKSKLMPQKKGGDTKMNLNIALHYVLDSLNVTEETRHQVFTQTTEEQKQQIVQKYFNRIKEEEKAQIGEFADNGSGSENVDPISEFDAVKYIDEMPEDALDQELELAFSDPDMNITGDAGSNLIRNMSEGSKRHFLKQFVRKKNEGEKAGLRKSSQKSQRSVVEERPVTGTPSDDSSLWRQPPEFFLKNISRKHESLRLLERDLVNLRIHLSLATSDGINSFLDCEVDVDGMTQTWSDSLDAALSRLTFSTTKSSSYRDIVNIGELRLSALQSLSILINHGKAQEALLSSFSLLSKITGYLFDFPEPSQSVGQDAVSFIKVKMAVVDVLGSICLFSVDGFRLVLHVLESISDIRRSSSRFLPLVSSILNPLIDREAYEHLDAGFLNNATDPMKSFGEQDLIWNFRSSFVIFLVALASAPEESLDRLKIRLEMEAAGLNLAFRSMLAWTPPEIVREHVELYYTDKAEDTEELQQLYKELNMDTRTPEEILSWLMELLADVQFSDYAYHLVLKTLSNLAHFTSLLATDPTKFSLEIMEEIMREETLDSLSFLQKLTSFLCESTASQNGDSKSALDKRGRHEMVAGRLGEMVRKHFGGYGEMTGQAVETVSVVGKRTVVRAQSPVANGAPQREASLAKSLTQPKRSVSAVRPVAAPEPVAPESPVISAQESAFYTNEMEKLKRKKTQALSAARAATDRIDDVEAVPAKALPERSEMVGEIVKKSGGEKIRSVRWTKIPDETIKGTVWEDIVAESYFTAGSFSDVIVDDNERDALLELFALSEQQAIAVAVAEQEAKPLLDPKRARNMEILLRGLRVPFLQLRDAVVEMNEEVLTLERLEILSRCMPTLEEMDNVISYDGPITNLGYAERFILTFATLDNPSDHVLSLIFRQTFSEDLQEIDKDIQTVLAASRTILSSTRLKRILRVVLIIGNSLSGSAEGVACGFDVESLLKLADVKADEAAGMFESAPTLLHYVGKRVYEIDEDALKVTDELDGLKGATKISLPDLLDTATSFNGRLSALNNLLRIRKTSGLTDRFDDVMGKFSIEVEERVTRLSSRIKEMESSLGKLTRYLGADRKPAPIAAGHIFSNLFRFSEMLSKSHAENLQTLSILQDRALRDNPLMKGLHDAKSRLKPVPNQEPFLRRLTVARPKISYMAVNLDDDNSSATSVARMSREKTMFKTVLAARKTARRATKFGRKATVAAGEEEEAMPQAIQDLL